MGKYDKLLLVVTCLLIGFGALMIYSTTSVVTPSLVKKGVTEFYYFKKHMFTILIGFCFMFITYTVNLSLIKKMAIPLLIISFVLLILVFLPSIGVSAGGARRWIRLWPSTFQPSEVVKIAMVIFLARYISMHGYKIDSFISFIKPVCVMIIFQLAILSQPDFGAAMSLGFLTFAMLFLSGVRLRYIASLLIFAVPAIFMLITEPYRMKRLTSFLNPWEDPKGSGFQLVQSFIALGSGGLTGVGLGSSKQKLSYLPESHTDFIFSIIGEEFGFIGVSIVIGLFIMLFIKSISIANKAKDEFIYYLAVGLSLMVSLQSLINFAVATGIVPTKGLPLPFISYGGSALLVNMAAIGMLLNISKNEHISTILSDKEMVMRRRAKRNIYGIKKVQKYRIQSLER
ncbi:MAG: putative lipid II flippase FtsW [Nitrospirota bacterium]